MTGWLRAILKRRPDRVALLLPRLVEHSTEYLVRAHVEALYHYVYAARRDLPLFTAIRRYVAFAALPESMAPTVVVRFLVSMGSELPLLRHPTAPAKPVVRMGAAFRALSPREDKGAGHQVVGDGPADSMDEGAGDVVAADPA